MRWTEDDLTRYLHRGPGGTMSEARLLAIVRDVAKRLELLCYHTHISKLSEPGFPDIILCGHGGLWAYELKREGKEPTLAQEHWLDALARVERVYTGVLRPSTLEAFVAALKETR
jgi:hypothetical protein